MASTEDRIAARESTTPLAAPVDPEVVTITAASTSSTGTVGLEHPECSAALDRIARQRRDDGPAGQRIGKGSRRLVGFDGPQKVRLGAGGGHGAQEYCQNERVPTEPCAYAIGLRIRFRGITERQGMVWRGAAGWAEWSPFLDYDGPELVPWLRAADEAADLGWPERAPYPRFRSTSRFRPSARNRPPR